jgi:hypothetical protein
MTTAIFSSILIVSFLTAQHVFYRIGLLKKKKSTICTLEISYFYLSDPKYYPFYTFIFSFFFFYKQHFIFKIYHLK